MTALFDWWHDRLHRHRYAHGCERCFARFWKGHQPFEVHQP